MKRLKLPFRIIILFIFSFLLGACSKDKEDTSPILSPFAENESLIVDNSEYYFIADISIDGVESKINMQTSLSNCDPSWGAAYCSNGHYEFKSHLERVPDTPRFDVTLGFRGKCPACSFDELVNNDNINNFCSSEDQYNGIRLTIFTKAVPNSTVPNLQYSSYFTPAKKNDSSNFNLVEISKNQGAGHTVIGARFNCTIQSSSASSVIQIKNAIYRGIVD